MKNTSIVEFGDFQTPRDLADETLGTLRHLIDPPRSIIEPTCGRGSYLLSAMESYRGVEQILGLDINPAYIGHAEKILPHVGPETTVRLIQGDFFSFNWANLIDELPKPILLIGNPPWVTNSVQGMIGSANLPVKKNMHGYLGMEALTGKSNFDISEWMLIKILDLLSGTDATVAMLCKKSVARKALSHAWMNNIRLKDSHLFPIDAKKHFNASVEACFFVCRLSPSVVPNHDCLVYDGLSHTRPAHVIGFHDGHLIAEVALYEKWKHLAGDSPHRWRSGIKHDCSRVMDLKRIDGDYLNGLGEIVKIEDDLVYPLLKSSDIANGAIHDPRRFVIVTQRKIGDDTSNIEGACPETWSYLTSHEEYFTRRRSSIYKGRPLFSVFGVGDYAFKPWKVAISGFYRGLSFQVVGPVADKPCMLDDTIYFLSFDKEHEAKCVAEMLNSEPARGFYEAFIFWDAKRPVTSEILKRLSLNLLAQELGVQSKFDAVTSFKNERTSSLSQPNFL